MKLFVTYVFSLLAFWGTAQAASIEVHDAWIAEAPPTSMVLAGYMVIENGTDTAVALVGVESPVFAHAELHRTMVQEGMARMMPQPRIEIPAHTRLVFKPGDYHLMLMRPRRTLQAGDTVNLLLKFEDGQQISVTAEVRKMYSGVYHPTEH